MTTTYETQLAIVQRLKPSATDNDRHIEWCVSSGVVGLARTPEGRIEIFLEGMRLQARFRRVREALEYQRWFRSGGDELLANRILLPAAGHFEQVAAFLCTELLRAGAVEDLAGAFSRAEALIELAIEDLTLADESLLGLSGEMLLLRALLREAPTEHVRDVVESWKGYRETARDFQLGGTGVEAKTTTSSTSSHVFSGVHQLEVGHSVDASEERSYLVASLGLEWPELDDLENTTSLPEVVDGVIGRLDQVLGASASVLVNELISNIANYGSATLGYDHRTMAGIARFRRPFRLRFARGYDFADPAIRLLTTDDMRARPFIDIDSLSLRINLPEYVSGDLNPVVGLSNFARRIVGREWIITK